MPQQKDLKRIVRARMEKTGESYTTARLHTVNRKEAPAPPPPPPDYAALAGTRDEAVQKNTGRSWAEWVALLDAFDGTNKPHRDVAAYVYSLGGVSGWWSQSVTVGYERIRGLREIGQRRTGSWEANKSRTFHVPLPALFEACANARKRAKWLTGAKPKVRTSTPGKSIRMTWDDGTDVQLWFTAKGEEKCSLAVQHAKLPDKETSERLKAFWAERLDALAEAVR